MRDSDFIKTPAAMATFLRRAHLNDINTLIHFMEQHPASIFDLQFIINDDRWIVFDPIDLFLGNFPTMTFVFSENPVMQHIFKMEANNVDLLARLKEYRDFLTH